MKKARWSLTLFARHFRHRVDWWTLGLGALNVEIRGKGPSSALQALEQKLGAQTARARVAALAACHPPLSARLVKVRLDLDLRQRRVTGFFPLIVMPLHTATDQRELAFCPFRQQDFFVVDPDADLTRQANRHFKTAWLELDDETAWADWSWTEGDRLTTVVAKVPLPELRPAKKAGEKLQIGAGRQRENVLQELGSHLAEDLAAELDRGLPLEGPSPETERVLEQLRGPHPRPLVLVGPAGCGKSTLWRRALRALMVEDLYLEHGRLDLCLDLHRLAGRHLIAGMSYFGEWEQRCLDLLEECRERRAERARQPEARTSSQRRLPAAARVRPTALWVEDLAAWGRIGQSRESERSLAEVFLGALSRGELLLLGEATPEAWALLEADAPSFASHFARCEVGRPTASQTFQILLSRARRAESVVDIQVDPGAYRVLLETTPALYGDNAHPGYSSHLLGQALDEADAHSLASDGVHVVDGIGIKGKGNDGSVVDGSGILALMARESGISEELLTRVGQLEASKVRAELGRHLFGQDEALEAVVDVVLTLKAGLVDPKRPLGVLLFAGPTGTGKTELAKTLAHWLFGRAGGDWGHQRLLRFDMGENADPEAVARLIGDRWQPRGLLTEAVRAQPFAVLLFDEIEKAHPTVLQLLLQVFEDGRLTDALGQVADFRQCVVILTSNLGSEGRSQLGLGQKIADLRHDTHRAIERFFAPELFNRIDRVVFFQPLAPEIARRIVAVELDRLGGRRGLRERGTFLEVLPQVVDRVVELGFDAAHGARGLQRYLDRKIVPLLTEALASASPTAFLLLRLATADTPDPGPFVVTATSVAEAAPLPGHPDLDRLFALPAARMVDEIPQLLARLATLEKSEKRSQLDAELGQRLVRFSRENSADDADAVYELDFLRGRLQTLSEKLQLALDTRHPDEGELRESLLTRTQPARDFDGRRRHLWSAPASAPALPTTEALVEIATEIFLLEAELSASQEERQFRATVELAVVAEHHDHHVASAGASLLQELAELICSDAQSLEKFASDLDHGDGHGWPAFRRVLERQPRRLVAQLAGSALREKLRADVGTYVRRRSSGQQEVVRIQVFGGQRDPSHLVAQVGPERLPPLLQTLDWDPQGRELASCQVADFALCLEVDRPCRRLADVLRPLRRRRQLLSLHRERP